MINEIVVVRNDVLHCYSLSPVFIVGSWDSGPYAGLFSDFNLLRNWESGTLYWVIPIRYSADHKITKQTQFKKMFGLKWIPEFRSNMINRLSGHESRNHSSSICGISDAYGTWLILLLRQLLVLLSCTPKLTIATLWCLISKLRKSIVFNLFSILLPVPSLNLQNFILLYLCTGLMKKSTFSSLHFFYAYLSPLLTF